jgi:hypothetical protein
MLAFFTAIVELFMNAKLGEWFTGLLAQIF